MGKLAGQERWKAKGGFSSLRPKSLFPLIEPDRSPRTHTVTRPTFRTLPVKHDTTCIRATEYYLAIETNALESFLMRWVVLEPVGQGEVSQKEENKYCALTHICGTQKGGSEDPVCRASNGDAEGTDMRVL